MEHWISVPHNDQGYNLLGECSWGFNLPSINRITPAGMNLHLLSNNYVLPLLNRDVLFGRHVHSLHISDRVFLRVLEVCHQLRFLIVLLFVLLRLFVCFFLIFGVLQIKRQENKTVKMIFNTNIMYIMALTNHQAAPAILHFSKPSTGKWKWREKSLLPLVILSN